MLPILSGSYAHSLDDRGRIAVPAKLREKLGDGVWVTVSLGKLGLYPPDVWQRHIERYLAVSPFDPAGLNDRLDIFSMAQECDIDKQGRVLIPPDLRQAVRLSNDVVLVGVGDHIQVWNQDDWRVMRGRLDERQAQRCGGSIVRKRTAFRSASTGSSGGLER